MIKLSVSETKWSSLLARTRALILYISIWIFDFGPVKLPELSRNGPQVWKLVWKITFSGLKSSQDLRNRAAHPHQEFPGVPPAPPSWYTVSVINNSKPSKCVKKISWILAPQKLICPLQKCPRVWEQVKEQRVQYANEAREKNSSSK